MLTPGIACRFKVAGSLKRRFDTPKDAEKFYRTGSTTSGRKDCGSQACLSTESPNAVVGDNLSLKQVSVWLLS